MLRRLVKSRCDETAPAPPVVAETGCDPTSPLSPVTIPNPDLPSWPFNLRNSTSTTSVITYPKTVSKNHPISRTTPQLHLNNLLLASISSAVPPSPSPVHRRLARWALEREVQQVWMRMCVFRREER